MGNLEKLINFFILLLLGILLGFNVFLTFIVAPLMFSHFNVRLAGEIMNIIFPYYFSSGWVIGLIIYTLIAFLSIKNKNIVSHLKYFIIALSVFILSCMALHKAILPLAQNLNNTYYMLLDENKKEEAVAAHEKFKKLHIASSTLNIVNLLLLLFLMFNFYNYLNKKEYMPK
jgi:hypothetical protein